ITSILDGKSRSASASGAETSFLSLFENVSAANYEGYEFDDFLASPLIRFLSFDQLLFQRVWIQVGELLPVNLRPLLFIPRLPSTKASVYFAKGFLFRFSATGDPRWLTLANDRLGWLLKNPSLNQPGMSWGNHFDFASRGGFYPKGLPTVVWTSHAAEAFEM